MFRNDIFEKGTQQEIVYNELCQASKPVTKRHLMGVLLFQEDESTNLNVLLSKMRSKLKNYGLRLKTYQEDGVVSYMLVRLLSQGE